MLHFEKILKKLYVSSWYSWTSSIYIIRQRLSVCPSCRRHDHRYLQKHVTIMNNICFVGKEGIEDYSQSKIKGPPRSLRPPNNLNLCHVIDCRRVSKNQCENQVKNNRVRTRAAMLNQSDGQSRAGLSQLFSS